MILGFRSRNIKNMLKAIIYYLLCLYPFYYGIRVGIASFLLLAVTPTAAVCVYEALYKGQRKKIVALPIWIAVFAVSILIMPYPNEINKDPQPTPAVIEEPAANSESVPGGDSIIVYVTKHGTKYHKKDCRMLKNEVIGITLNEAVADGKQPCKVCLDGQPPQ